nr:hypothetical protein [Armatimonadota bacterium]
MKKGFVSAAAALLAVAFATQTESLYSGQLIAETGVTLSSWGGGKISEVKDVSLAGGNALKVETTNYFQGGLIQWAKPIDLTAAAQNKDAMLAVGVWIVNP